MTLSYIAENRRPLLDELRRRQAVVRDFVRAVTRRYATGLYLFGRPGTAKSYTVRAALGEGAGEIYVYQRGHLTPVGLFELLAENPDRVIVLDDLSSLFRSEVALQILLSALESPTARDRSRVIKYRRQGREERTLFRGGVVCISNKELHDDELLGAFKSRVNVLNYNPADTQLGALMLDIASRGWPGGRPTIPPAECEEVARFVIAEMLRLGCRFDLRLFCDKAVPSYRQWKDGGTESHWQDLVAAAVEESLVELRHPTAMPESRSARKGREREVLKQILNECASREERVRAWAERTGRSERAFYRRLAELP
jgi:hypothetical protein